MCKDRLPEPPNSNILALFQKRQDLLDSGGPSAPGIHVQTMHICCAIAGEKARVRILRLGSEKRWPEIINFSSFHACILAHERTVLKMLKNPVYLANSTVWNRFLQNIDHRVFAFSAAASKAKFPRALSGCHCG